MVSDQHVKRGGLVVDDNRINRRVAAAMLKRLGYTDIVEAENGLEALELVKADAFELVLMDCEMPVMSGIESTRQIRLWEAESGTPACHIVALTAGGVVGDSEQCIEAGMDHYLTKPLQFEVLKACIENLTRSDPSVKPVTTRLTRKTTDDIPVLDIERYEKMCLLLREGVGEFYHDYLAATREKLDEIQSQPDMSVETSARTIHSIRGSASNVGALQLRELAEQLEHYFESGDRGILFREINRLQDALRDFEAQVLTRLA